MNPVVALVICTGGGPTFLWRVKFSYQQEGYYFFNLPTDRDDWLAVFIPI